MFEYDAIKVLENTDIVDYVSRFNGKPSIFSGIAPEGSDFPYITVNDRLVESPDSIISRFLLTVEIFDYSTSKAIVDTICFLVINSIDNIIVSNDRYDGIRLRRDIYFYIEVPDPRGLQCRVQFTARAGRKGWMKTL